MTTDLFEVVLVNFGITTYSGYDLAEAKAKAKNGGFESAVMRNGEPICYFSPINGFRFTQS